MEDEGYLVILMGYIILMGIIYKTTQDLLFSFLSASVIYIIFRAVYKLLKIVWN